MPAPVTYRGMSLIVPDNDSEWREFYAHVLAFNPDVVTENFNEYPNAIEAECTACVQWVQSKTPAVGTPERAQWDAMGAAFQRSYVRTEAFMIPP